MPQSRAEPPFDVIGEGLVTRSLYPQDTLLNCTSDPVSIVSAFVFWLGFIFPECLKFFVFLLSSNYLFTVNKYILRGLVTVEIEDRSLTQLAFWRGKFIVEIKLPYSFNRKTFRRKAEVINYFTVDSKICIIYHKFAL